MKRCVKCGKEKNESDFYFNKNKNKLENDCKECVKKRVKEYARKNKEKVSENKKKYYCENKEKLSKYKKEWHNKNRNRRLKNMKKYREENSELIAEAKKEWIKKNKEHLKQYKVKYYQENKKEIKEKRRGYEKNRSKYDIQYKLRRNFSRDIHIMLNEGKISSSLLDIIDYNLDELKKCIENQFIEEMNWNNYGSVWHIDHIIPKSIYDFTNKNDIKKCWSLKNLRPLLKEENLSKNNNLDMELIEEFNIRDLLPKSFLY